MVFKSSPIKSSPSSQLFISSGTLWLANVQASHAGPIYGLQVQGANKETFSELSSHFLGYRGWALRLSFKLELSQTTFLEHADYLTSYNNEARIHHPQRKEEKELHSSKLYHMCTDF